MNANNEGHWERAHLLAYVESLRELAGKLLSRHHNRSAVVKILWTMANSALAEAEQYNVLFPQERPLGPDDFVWLIEMKAELLKNWGREYLETPE